MLGAKHHVTARLAEHPSVVWVEQQKKLRRTRRAVVPPPREGDTVDGSTLLSGTPEATLYRELDAREPARRRACAPVDDPDADAQLDRSPL